MLDKRSCACYSHRRSQGGHSPQNSSISYCFVLCIAMPKQDTVARLKSKYLPPPKFWLAATILPHFLNLRESKNQSASTKNHEECLRPGPTLSRLDRLLPIGPRAKGGPALRLLTYANFHFLLNLLM